MGSRSDAPQVARCKSCGAYIFWVLTETGKAMPVNKDPSEKGNLVLKLRISSGQLHAEKYDPALHYGRNRFLSHFSTCAQAQQWRRP